MPDLLAIFILLFAIASCQKKEPVTFDGRRISAVDIRFVGNRPAVDEERLRVHMKTRSGDLYDVDRLEDDIRSLYESGFIDDARLFAEPIGDDVRLAWELTPRAPHGPGHHIVGNTAFSDQALAKSVDFHSWITMADFPESMRQRIEGYYHRNGYPNATVRCEPQDTKGYYNFIIEEGARKPDR